MKDKFENLTVCVSGASSGIGCAIAKKMARRSGTNCHLVLLARRMDRLNQIKQELESNPEYQPFVKVSVFQLDISNKRDVQNWAESQSTLLSQVQVLVNSAGLAKGRGPLSEGTPEDWDSMIDTNFKGLLYLTRVVLQPMVKLNRGHIINIGSVAGRWVYPHGNVYCATKFAVRALSEGLRMDLLGSSLRVTNIEPGLVETEFSLVRYGDAEKAKAVYQGLTPLKAEDVAESVLWCMAQPQHVNIQELVIFPTDQAGVQNISRR